MTREYEFFVATDQHHLVNGEQRVRVRQLVMQDFFQTKSDTAKKAESEHSSTATASNKAKLSSRFRLPQKRLPKVPRRRVRRKETTVTEDVDLQWRGRRADAARTACQHSKMPDLSRDMVGASATITFDMAYISNLENDEPGLPLKINPDTHRFDPFDVLPVPGSHELDIILRLHKSASQGNAITFNARITWWHFISNDAGLLHATLATWALYGVLARGLEYLRVEKLRHKNEAIKEINTKITNAGGVFSDELVGTVLTLASFENLLGAYDEATTHIDALKQMVNARGGLNSFVHNDGLVRGIIWVDFHNSVVLHTLPTFPHISLDEYAPPLPEALLATAADASPTSLLKLSFCAIECFTIFCNLHRLALCISTPWIEFVNRRTIGNLLYETERSILSQPDFSQKFHNFDHGIGESCDFDATDGSKKVAADCASVTEALLAAAQIFIYAGLREIPPKTQIFSILLSRLKLAINRPKTSMIKIWKSRNNLEILLWVVVVASAIAPATLAPDLTDHGGSTRSWWITQVAAVATELGLETEAQLVERVQRIAWTNALFGSHLPAIWRDMEELGLGNTRTGDTMAWHAILLPQKMLERKDSESTQASVSSAGGLFYPSSDNWRGGSESWIGSYEAWRFDREGRTLSEKSCSSEDTIDPRLLLRPPRDGSMIEHTKSLCSV